ncbi:MAG: FtsQ-type POTRA domain-containing protein [Kiritimatiellae bacterium]|nr:FtsQ-type POTRA domain-containing protein [Kiritimatiellia bacterium]
MIKRNKNVKRSSAAKRLISFALALLAVGGLVCAGVAIGVDALRDIWREQFAVRNSRIDVVVTSSGKIVHPDVITLQFGLTNGANLAEIPYAERRASLMKSIPNIRNLKVERRLPRRVTVEVEEREPAVRIAAPKSKADSGRVADFDGVVFRYFNCGQLPIIRETGSARAAAPGDRLAGNAAAALRLVKFLASASSDPDLSEMRVLEVDTASKDYLLVTFGDYSTAQIAWDCMDADTERSRTSLRRQLSHLAKAMAARLTPRTTRWIATDFGPGGRIYATDPARAARP